MRTREHSLSLRSSPACHLAVHCSRCGCVPIFNDLTILARNKSKTTREIEEAFFIFSKGEEECVSAPSVHFGDVEVLFIKENGRHV